MLRAYSLALVLAIARVIAADAAEPSFDVAVIKPSAPDLPGSALGGLHHGTFTVTNASLRQVLAVAYDMAEPRIVGPDWLDKARFDITAKSPPGVPDSRSTTLIQALLKERFKLAAHLEPREMPVYYLTVSRGGVKMPVYPALDRGPAHPGGGASFRGTLTTAQLAEKMAPIVNRPVIDKTGLTERYNIFLSYAPLSPQQGSDAAAFGPPDFFTAIQEHLGLKLQPGKASLDVVVVDHMEQMPTEN